MQYAGLTLTQHGNRYYFEDAALAETHNGKGANWAKRDVFVNRHGLKMSHSKKHPVWAALLPSVVRRSMSAKGTMSYIPKGDFTIMERLHDHVELFVKDGAYVYTTQPYDVKLEEYTALQSAWQKVGAHVSISYVDAWWYPGRTPLIVISQIQLG